MYFIDFFFYFFFHDSLHWQTYLQSMSVRFEEWRIKKRDSEQWMHHRQLPPELRQSVRNYNHYKWVATRGVDEEALLKSFPMNLRRDIKRHLCLDLVRRVSYLLHIYIYILLSLYPILSLVRGFFLLHELSIYWKTSFTFLNFFHPLGFSFKF